MHRQLVREQLRSAPLLLSVPVGNTGWLSFKSGAKMVRLGEEAAQAALPALLQRIDAP
jgi:hypothetical protein